MNDPTIASGRQPVAWLGMIAYSLLGNSAMSALPMLLGGLVDKLGFSGKQAGLVAAGEMGGFAFGMFTLIWLAPRVDRRMLAIGAVVVLTLTSMLSIFAETFVPMLTVRCVAGFGAAMSYSVFLTIAAGTEAPQKIFAVVNATSLAFTGVFTVVAPALLRYFGLTGLFGVKIGMALVVLLAIKAIPRIRAHKDSASSAIAETTLSVRGHRIAVCLVLLTMLALYLGHGGVWAYQERIGVSKGLLRQDVGLFLGTSVLVWGVLGSGFATILGLRIGWVWPQVISLILSILAAVFLVLTTSLLGFGVACALIAFTWYYGLPYQMGLLARFDPRGGANLAGSMMTTCGAACGPAVAAMILGRGGGYIGIGIMAGLSYALALLLVMPAALKAAGPRGRADLRRRPGDSV